MADTLSKDSLDVVTERSTRVVRERVATQVGRRSLGYAEDVGPLLNFLPEVLWVKRGITSRLRER